MSRLKRKQKASSDPRFDWRNPKMKVLRVSEDDETGERLIEAVSPEFAKSLSRAQLQEQLDDPDAYPSWKDDPTYVLPRRSRRRLR